MSLVIDSHQHFWQLDQPFDYRWLHAPQNARICRDFLPDRLLPLLESVHVNQTILVQTQHDVAENRWALRMAEQYDFLAGIVGWVDLASPDCERQLLEFTSHPKFVGVRHITQDEPDDDFIVRDDVIRGLRVLERHNVPFDLLFYVKHLPHATTLSKRLPNLRMVIDHLAKPRIKSRAFDEWVGTFRAAAGFPNVFCKLSGMITEADWDRWRPSDLKPYVDTALECFGPERCMFGSDWPVCELAGSYSQVFHALAELLAPLSESERAAVWGGTAARFYGLMSSPLL
jgi:L-fuconolactonase